MPRSIVLGNGQILVNFDQFLQMRDFYYPYVGMENHIGGHRNRLGVWVNGRLSWINEHGWERRIAYQPDSLVTDITAINQEMRLELLINDAVHYQKNIYLKKITVKNLSTDKLDVQIFFHHDFTISETDIGDTAFYEPVTKGICHYKKNRYLFINGLVKDPGIYQYAIGKKRYQEKEGTWRDAEDGYLEQTPIDHGMVDSTVSFRFELTGRGEEELFYWICIGESFQEVKALHQWVLENKPEDLIRKISTYWRSWVNKKERDFKNLPETIAKLFKRSLLILRTQIDKRGAILAANDTDIMLTAKDHYSYVWPRDGALVSLNLDKAGYPELTRSFFQYAARIISEGGFFLHKYHPDGSLGSSWHPWILNGQVQLPIQEDETALVLFALGEHYRLYPDVEFIAELYHPLIKKAADFLLSYRDQQLGLPLPSYDLWEERRGIFSFTSASVAAALRAAGKFADLLGDKEPAEQYFSGAEEIKAAMERYLYHEEMGRFLRGVYITDRGEVTKDFTIDSSLITLFTFHVFNPDDHKIQGTARAVAENLWVKTDIGGVARYPGDYYFRQSDDIERVPGNPWFITTLWLADWFISRASCLKDLDKARELLLWVTDRQMESGCLSEQIHPYTGVSLSVAPLTWSHAAFVGSVADYLAKYQELEKIE